MKEALISSSVLILALTALRFLFRKRISRRLQYALWGLVLLRLALPVQLPGARFSVMTGAERLTGQIEAVRPAPAAFSDAPVFAAVHPAASASNTSGPHTDSVPVTYKAPPRLNLVFFVWLSGAGLTLGCFLASNLRFSRSLRRNRTCFDVPGCPLPVYISGAAVSPCLFGLFRPAVYLTPRAAEGPEMQLRHILTHELCHYRHGDHLWSALRCLMLAVYWFDPLVWMAAVLSRVDGEQACDEAAVRSLGEEQRLPYGKTLVDMIAVRNAPSGLFCTATTMVSDKRNLKKRLERIVRRQKTLVWAIAAALLLAGALAGCTFTGAKGDAEPPDGPGAEDNYIVYTDTPDAVREEMDSRYDIYCYRYNMNSSPRLAVWAENWESGNLVGAQSLAEFELSGGPDDLALCLSEQMGENDDFRVIDFLLSNQKNSQCSSFYIPTGGEYNARANSWLGGGSARRYNVTEKEPIVLLCLAYHKANSGALNSYDCEYLMENPDAVQKYESAVLVKCAFASEDGQNASPPLIVPVFPGPEDAPVRSDYEVTLIKDGKETAVTGFAPSLPEDVVFNGLVKSAAWPSDGIGTRPFAFRIRQTLTTEDSSETHDYYAYRLDDGKAAILMGSMYTMLSEDLMTQLEKAAGIEPGQIYNLEAAISKAILEHAGGEGELKTEAHETLAVIVDDRSDGSLVTAYCMAMDMAFDSDGKTLSDKGGSHMPAAITFFQNPDGAYSLTEYWTPGDGAYYAPSIREKFPSDIAENAIDTQNYALALTQSCYAQAIDWFGLDLTDEIAETISLLCNTPNWEEPSPYVEPGYLDFRRLLFYGDETLRYVFSGFLKGGQTGERGRVLDTLMSSLLEGENIGVIAEDGQDYFDQWKEHVLRLYELNDLDYFREYAPKSYLLLDVMGLTLPRTIDAPA